MEQNGSDGCTRRRFRNKWNHGHKESRNKLTVAKKQEQMIRWTSESEQMDLTVKVK
jgi:hypothetical protein